MEGSLKCRSVFGRVLQGISGKVSFVQRYDATNRRSISQKNRLNAAKRLLADGMSFDDPDELVEKSSSSVRQSILEFTEHGVHVFGNKYLHHPKKEHVKIILAINEGRYSPGCVGG